MVVAVTEVSATSSVQSSIFDMTDHRLIEKNPACAIRASRRWAQHSPLMTGTPSTASASAVRD
jgi:hypothetical protein